MFHWQFRYGGCGCAQCELQQKRYVARELSQRAQAIQAAIPTQFPPSAALVASEGAEKDATASAASLMRKFPFDLSLQVQEDIAGKVQRDQQIRRATPAGRHIQVLFCVHASYLIEVFDCVWAGRQRIRLRRVFVTPCPPFL